MASAASVTALDECWSELPVLAQQRAVGLLDAGDAGYQLLILKDLRI